MAQEWIPRNSRASQGCSADWTSTRNHRERGWDCRSVKGLWSGMGATCPSIRSPGMVPPFVLTWQAAKHSFEVLKKFPLKPRGRTPFQDSKREKTQYVRYPWAESP